MSKFSKQQQQRFQKDLQGINLDSDSELEDSFYGKQMARLQSQLNQLKASKKEDPILAMMRKNIQNQNKMIAQYETQVTQLRRITHNEQKNVIDQSVLEEIKNRVAIKANQSVLHLADQQYNLSVVRQSLIQQKQMEGSKLFGKKRGFLQEIQKQQQLLKKRLESANAEREHLAMQQQDKLSMKYEMDYLSKLFSQRFLRPKLKKLEQKDCKVRIVSTSIKGTFTNLTPEIVNQANILPKNSPEIALKLLRNNKRKSLKSISETNVKLQPKLVQINPQAFEQVESLTNQAAKGKLIQSLQHHFVSYISYISGFLGSLSQISKNYSPKFLKFLDEKQKNINYQFNDSQMIGKQKLLSQVASLENSKQLKQIKLTLESITSVSGLQHFINIQEAQLQFNSINMLKPIQFCKKLIQINLSYNKLKNISSISHLPWLRLLNIEHNLVNQLKLPCKSLQIVWGGHNLIEEVDLNQSKYLRILILNNNKLNQLPRLKLHNLEELNMNRNQLRSLRNLQELILLKKLNLSNNRFELVDEKLTFLYLNQLNLSHNYIKKLNTFFLPCLERLYLNNNKIAQRTNAQLYLPNLKELNLDENRLEGFSPIWQLLLHSRKLEYLRYSNNQYFLNLREKTRQIFEYFIYKHMDNAKIINENQMDIGIKKYYQSNYDIYYHGIKFFKENSILIKSIENNINFILQQFNFAGDLQKNKRSFIRQKQYIYYQSIRKIKQLEQIVSFVKQYTNKGNHLIAIDSSLFYHFDQFQMKQRNLYHCIRTLVVKKRYRKKQRLNYFIKNKPKICQILQLLTYLHNFSEKKKTVLKFKHLLKGLNQNQAAIMIQKVWRGYVRRKLYKRLQGLKNYKPDSDSDFEDVDTDFFNQELEHHQFDIGSIEGLDFQEMIIRPDVFQYIQNKQKHEKGQKIKEDKKQAALTAQQKKLMVNNFLDSRTKLKNNETKPNEQKNLAVQWGITDPRLIKTLQYKQQKKAEVVRKEMEKYMTPDERLQKFRRGGR